MADDPGKAAVGEPSMEDILASIRRILAEDGAAGDSDDAGRAPEPDKTAAVAQEDGWPPTAAISRPHLDEAFSRDAGEPQPAAGELAANARRTEVFVLTPEMRVPIENDVPAPASRVMSHRTADTGTDVLSQLASAILDRRDIAIGSRDVTLESMVREMLRPLLREWLDRNLPYLIERLVKREIDLMVNRAERLED
jgi:cell pole-organizing protein PopZ